MVVYFEQEDQNRHHDDAAADAKTSAGKSCDEAKHDIAKVRSHLFDVFYVWESSRSRIGIEPSGSPENCSRGAANTRFAGSRRCETGAPKRLSLGLLSNSLGDASGWLGGAASCSERQTQLQTPPVLLPCRRAFAANQPTYAAPEPGLTPRCFGSVYAY